MEKLPMSSEHVTYLNKLPRDINNELLKQLSYPEIINLCKTNKQWNNICKDEKVWQILSNRDFPKLRPIFGGSFRKLYEDLWHNIDKAINGLIKDKLIANRRYVDINLMKQDLFVVIRNFMIKHWNIKEYDFDDWNEFKIEILTIISALNPKYINSTYLNPDKFDEDDISPVKILLDDYNFIADF